MGRPRPNDGEPGAAAEAGYPRPDAQQDMAAPPPAAYPPPMSPPVNPVVSGYDAAGSSPVAPGAAAAAYPPGEPEPAPYPPPSPYPPPEQYPPVTGQPLPEGYGTAAVQPQGIGVPWSTGLFDCHEHQTNAIMTALFPCVTFGQIAEILDAGQTSCTMGSLMYLLLGPALCTCFVLGCSYRAKLRQRYDLVQAPAEDWILHLFCPCCALCQEFREIRNRGIDPSLGYLGNLAQLQKGTTTVPPQTQFMNA